MARVITHMYIHVTIRLNMRPYTYEAYVYEQTRATSTHNNNKAHMTSIERCRDRLLFRSDLLSKPVTNFNGRKTRNALRAGWSNCSIKIDNNLCGEREKTG